MHVAIKRVLAEGDLVVLHVHMYIDPGDNGLAIAEFYRIADGKIAEHWDVSREVMPTEKAANPHTEF